MSISKIMAFVFGIAFIGIFVWNNILFIKNNVQGCKDWW